MSPLLAVGLSMLMVLQLVGPVVWFSFLLSVGSVAGEETTGRVPLAVAGSFGSWSSASPLDVTTGDSGFLLSVSADTGFSMNSTDVAMLISFMYFADIPKVLAAASLRRDLLSVYGLNFVGGSIAAGLQRLILLHRLERSLELAKTSLPTLILYHSIGDPSAQSIASTS